MALRLVVGRTNTGKTRIALGLMRDAHSSGREPVLVLPSQPDVLRAADELAKQDALGFRVTTFDSYLEDAWARCGDGRSIIKGPTRQLLVNSAARRADSGSGTGDLALSCVTVLAGQLGEGWRSSSPSVAGAGARLAQTILVYRDALDRLGLVEREEAAHALAAMPGLPGDPLVVHRFIDFSPWQERLLVGASATREVLVTLPWEADYAPTAALDALVGRLSIAPEVVEGPMFHTKQELSLLADRLFSEVTPIPAEDAVRFSFAEGYEAEAHRIAEEVRCAMAVFDSRGSESSIAVVFRHPERHFRCLKEAFDEAGIEAEYDIRLPLGSTTFGAAILSLLGFMVSGDRDLLLSLLKSPYCDGGREEVLDLERSWRAEGTTGRIALVDSMWRASKSLQRVVRLAEKATQAEMDAAAARTLSEAVGALLVIGYGRDSLADAIVKEDAAAHATIQRLLTQVAAINDGAIQIQDVIDVLRRSVVTTNAMDKPGVVQVTAVDRVRGRRYDTVIIGGLNTDEFPAVPPESMLPGSAVAAVVEKFGGSGEPPKGVEHEQLLFYMALTRAQQRLVLSTRTADSDGTPAGVSHLFETVADFCRVDPDDARPPAQERALSQTPRLSDAATPRERLRAEAAEVNPSSARSLAARWRSRSRVAAIREQRSLERLSGAAAYSPSALETYLECPYLWFFSRAIGARTLESEFDAREQGTMAHDVLSRTYERFFEQDHDRVTPETLERAQAIARTVWDEISEQAGEPATVFERSERRATLRWATRILEDDAAFAPGFKPTHMEWAFGTDGDEPVDIGGLVLRGRIDRIDVDEANRAVIIDYKRTSGPSADDILKNRKIQVPLYLEAVRVKLGLRPVAGIFRGLRTRNDRGLILSDVPLADHMGARDLKEQSEFDAIVEASLELARGAVAGIRDGRIEQAPRDPASCVTCRARAVCGGAR